MEGLEALSSSTGRKLSQNVSQKYEKIEYLGNVEKCSHLFLKQNCLKSMINQGIQKMQKNFFTYIKKVIGFFLKPLLFWSVILL